MSNHPSNNPVVHRLRSKQDRRGAQRLISQRQLEAAFEKSGPTPTNASRPPRPQVTSSPRTRITIGEMLGARGVSTLLNRRERVRVEFGQRLLDFCTCDDLPLDPESVMDELAELEA